MNIEHTQSPLSSDLLNEIEANQDKWKPIYVQESYKRQPQNYMKGITTFPFWVCGCAYVVDSVLFGIWTDDMKLPPPMGIITPSIVEATKRNPSVLINLYIPDILWCTKIKTPKQSFFSSYKSEFSENICDIAIIETPKNNQIQKYNVPDYLLQK